jgi:hypothetical protein
MIFELHNFITSLLDFADTLYERYVFETEDTPDGERDEDRIRTLQISIASVIVTALTYKFDDELGQINDFYKCKIEEVRQSGCCYGCDLR